MKTLFALAENNSTTNWRNGLKSDNKTSSDNNNNSKYYSNGNRTATTTMGAQQWHLKQLGQEFCFIFISRQTETGSCCCKIYKEKIRRKCKVFHGVFLSYQTIFSLASYFHGKLTWRWATVELAGRTTRAHYESVGFIKNIASLAQHFNVTKSRQHNVCFPLLPLLCLGYSFRIFHSSSRVSFAANC